MTEAELRELVAKDLSALEPGLRLLSIEQYIPSELGTRSFVDLYAQDERRRHVLIELKRSDASSREALHELNKYVEAVKSHFGAKDHEIRTIVASTEWRELLVPFSRFVNDTTISAKGVLLLVSDDGLAVTASEVDPLPIAEGRFIAPWHDMFLFRSKKSLDRSVALLEKSMRSKRIHDHVIVILKFRVPTPSEHQQKILSVLSQLSSSDTIAPRNSPDQYEYVAYSALQLMSEERCLDILRKDPFRLQDVKENLDNLEGAERMHYLHSELTEMQPRPKYDYFEIGYPAKFSRSEEH